MFFNFGIRIHTTFDNARRVIVIRTIENVILNIQFLNNIFII